MHARRWILAFAAALASAAAGRPAAAQNPEVAAEGTANVGYSRFTQSVFQADPMADPENVPEGSSSRAFTEIRPGLWVQSGRPRLYWRLAYQFSGNFAFDGGAPQYSNQGDLSMFALPSKYTSLSMTALVAQGGTSFLLNQRPADTGQPELRAQGNPNLLSASLVETLSWDAGRQLALRQSLSGNLSSPQDDPSQFNGALAGSLVLERVFKRFSAGLEVRSSVARLRQLAADPVADPVAEPEPYLSITSSLLARLNHDFTYRWNGLATAGVEQVYTGFGSQPLAILPSATVAAVYTHGDTSGVLDLSHSTITNLQVGTIAISDRITARGIYTLDVRKLRAISFSAGFLHNEPIGESSLPVAAGTGNAVQVDAGFTTAITKYILGTARYSLAYQFGQDGGLEPLLAHIFTIGVTGRYSNTDKIPRPLPGRGRRVDGSDARGLPAGGDPVADDDAPQAP